MSLHLSNYRDGFGPGFTPVTRFDDAEDNTGIAFGVLKLAGGETWETMVETETAWLLMHGKANVAVAGSSHAFARTSLFDEGPSCIHVSAGESVRIDCNAESEFTVYSTANTERFEPRVFAPNDVPTEHRGKDQVGNACYRFVRTIFDRTNSDANAELVLGEVITMPGRWSSYPPHHHAQPEIYHYRFTKPGGFGHAELGETFVKVRQYDTTKIHHGIDHAQAAAPGYGMYYTWVIRHLAGNPYIVPEFTEEHAWVMDEDADIWRPPGVGDYD